VRRQLIRNLCSLTAIGLCTAVNLADESPASEPETADEKVARLEALLEAQQKRIDQLEQRVAVGSAREQESQRVEAMRQQIREILSEKEFRESLMPSTVLAGYDNGFVIRSSDEKFLLRTNGRLQFRWTHYATRADNRYLNPGLQRNDRTGFDLQRLRLTFSGHAWDKDLTYLFELRADAPDQNRAEVQFAWVNYRFYDELQFMAGIFRLASTRAQVMSDANLQLIDRPVTDAVFGLGIGLGARVWGRAFDKRLEYYLDVVNSLNTDDNRTITPDPAEMDSNPAILARLVWHALGEEPLKDFVDQGDLEFHQTPALDLGFHYAFNEDEGDSRTTRLPFPLTRNLGRGGFGLTNTNGLQINQFGWDAGFKYMGFSATAEYILRIVDPRRAGRQPFSPWWLLTGQEDTTVQHGAYGQIGYFLPIPGLEKKLEAVAHVGGISTLANGREGTWVYGGGLNYYIQGNKVKLQTDVMKVSEVPISSNERSLANVNDDALVFRVQLQVAF